MINPVRRISERQTQSGKHFCKKIRESYLQKKDGEAVVAEVIAFSFEEYADILTVVGALTAAGLFDAAEAMLEKAAALRPRELVPSMGGFPDAEHGIRWRLAMTRGDIFEAEGLRSLRAPSGRAFNHVEPLSVELAREVSSHARTEIPRVIHHIWMGHRPVPRQPQEAWTAWCQKYGYEYKIWNEEMVSQLDCFHKPHVQSLYAEKRYAGAADIVRAEILLKHGGLYTDMDMFPVDTGYSLHETLNMQGIICLIAKGYRKTTIGAVLLTNSILGCTPNHPIMRRYYNAMEMSWQKLQIESAWWSVGACLLTTVQAGAVNAIHSNHVGSIAPAQFDNRAQILADMDEKRALMFFSCKPW